MRRIVLDMQCRMFADAISKALTDSDPDFSIRFTESPDDTANVCKSSRAYALIMEVTGHNPWSLKERVQLCNEVKRKSPECKVVFLVDEKADTNLAGEVRQAKKDGFIDNFIYGSVSPTYLSAVIDTL